MPNISFRCAVVAAAVIVRGDDDGVVVVAVIFALSICNKVCSTLFGGVFPLCLFRMEMKLS